MDAKRRNRAKELFLALRERRPQQRLEHLASECSGDDELRWEVESLLLEYDRLETDPSASPGAAGRAPDAAPEARVGEEVGRYRILSLVGQGGMGAVYEAEDPELGRRIALKVLPIAFAADPDRLARFKREARSLAALNHPNVVTIHSVEKSTEQSTAKSPVGESSDVHFFTMELVPGEPLTRLIPEDGLEVNELLGIAVQVADGLRAAHDQGIVHRDLKPDNIMVDPEGRVRILDFGLAKNTVLDPEDMDNMSTSVLRTRAGVVMGTVPYMSPEQVKGHEMDLRTDIFSFGVVLYEMVTGRRPFAGDSSAELASAILRESPPSLVASRPGLPEGLVRVIERCLEKEPGMRFQTANDLIRELKGVRSDRIAGLVLPASPVAATPLIGREAHLEEAEARLRDGARVLTISGYGGTGKTRFSMELLHRLGPEYDGGTGFVSLASVTDAADVLLTVAAALGIPEAHGRSAQDALCAVIGDRRVLLVLDNLEQVLDAASDLAAVVSRCPALQCIVTSRAPLRIRAEVDYSLPPLALPEPETAALDELLRCPAVALFVERAENARPGFALDEDNAPAIAEICRRLDGLPLALELAAARVRILAPATLLERLDHALDLLTSGNRDLPLRQRTLRATISWSYSLLEASEQCLLRRLSCFNEGFTLDALEQVCYGEEERYQALDELESLVEKGLVRVLTGDRYGLLETIRAFAAEELEGSGEAQAARRAHAEYFLRLAERVAIDLRTPSQVEAIDRAQSDSANLNASIQFFKNAARAGDGEALEQGLLLCGFLDWFWHLRAQHMTARTALDALLALAEDRPPSRGRALAQLAAGMISTTTDEWERSLREWRGGFDDGEAVGDAEAAAEGMMGLGYCHLSLGQMEEAEAALDEAISRSTGVSDFVLGLSLAIKGMLRFATGDPEAGIELVQKARKVQERIADCEGGGLAQSFLAQMTFAQGDVARAFVLYQDALALFETVGDYPEIARVHCEMGWTALAAGDPPAALQSFRRGVLSYEKVGSPRGVGQALLGLAAVEAAEGRSERAVTIAAAARAFSEQAGVVIEHPMDPDVVDRIEALKASIPEGREKELGERATVLTPAAVLALVGEG